MNRTTIIWLGVVLFIVLCTLCLLFHAKKIETILSDHAAIALQNAGITGIDVNFDGRNAILSGAVTSEDFKQKAAALIQSLSGVRSVVNDVSIESLEIEATEIAEEPEVNLSELLSKLIVNFETNSSELNVTAKPVVNQILTLLKNTPEAQIKIVGYTDSRGTDAYNKKLSQRRAQSVKTFLVSNGLRAERFAAVGLGESKPIADNTSEAGMAKNRRVEFIVMKED